ncbi:heparinase II/III family protein [uncultured Ruegeria sp.]|uniref:heparinase II/III domain-containing protein n=1 Tax=uncultured Ruegeria sp. TaxID=259304 RepID=UPI00261188B2|nr:heparinase II/III family protein [uncultured Ruegeria sp.]
MTLPALNLIWRRDEGVSPAVREPTALWFGGRGIVAMRSAWTDPEATYLGFKAGPNRSHHNNLDAGTFVIDAKGVRWAVDLGLGNYDLPGYFTSNRFDYYRTATIGQNTLSFGAANQNPTGRAHIEDFAQVPGFDFAIAGLSDTYDLPRHSVQRGIALVGGEAVLIQDEITGDLTGPMAWTMHTMAQVDLQGDTAVLTQDGQQMTAVILSPPEAQFDLRSANPCDTPYNADCSKQNPNTGIQRLMIALDLESQADRHRITVAIAGSAKDVAQLVPEIRPLYQWRLASALPRAD